MLAMLPNIVSCIVLFVVQWNVINAAPRVI